jgi:mono/diheme cytochrome c family protein
MNKRVLEFFGVLAAIACLVVLFWRPHSPRATTSEPIDTTPTPLRSQSAPPEETVAYTHATKEDFMNAEGMHGWEETLQTPIPVPSQQKIEKGAKLFQANCSSCHGSLGKGDGESAQAFDPPPTDLTQPNDYKYGRRELGLFRTSKYGVDGTGMVPWEGIMTDDDLWNVTFYVQFLQEE